jgi:hypothetical protein
MMSILSILAVAAFLTIRLRINRQKVRSNGDRDNLSIDLSAIWQRDKDDHLLD